MTSQTCPGNSLSSASAAAPVALENTEEASETIDGAGAGDALTAASSESAATNVAGDGMAEGRLGTDQEGLGALSGQGLAFYTRKKE